MGGGYLPEGQTFVLTPGVWECTTVESMVNSTSLVWDKV